jgi:hypothetical protein
MSDVFEAVRKSAPTPSPIPKSDEALIGAAKQRLTEEKIALPPWSDTFEIQE